MLLATGTGAQIEDFNTVLINFIGKSAFNTTRAFK